MKSKHYIETIEDIKYCEKKGLTIYSDVWKPDFFRFVDGVWCMYSDKELKIYNHSFDISYDELYYKDELKEEPMQEATEEDELALCVFWRGDSHKYYGVLDYIQGSGDFKMIGGSSFPHCRRLSPAEVAEITGYKVEEK